MAGRPGNIKQLGGFQAPPPLGQQAMKAAGTATATLGQPTAGTGEAAN